MSNGVASGTGERATIAWSRCPPTSVTTWSYAFRRASHARQSYESSPVRQQLAQEPELGSLLPPDARDLVRQAHVRQPAA